MFREYYFVFFFILLCSVISFVLLFLTFWAGVRDDYSEKVSVYECGFDPFEDTRGTFDVHFYLTAILFIVFDLEFIYLFPWLVLDSFSSISFYVYLIFMILLILGLAYELQTKALEWTRT